MLGTIFTRKKALEIAMQTNPASVSRRYRLNDLSVLDDAPDDTLLSFAELSALSGWAVVTLRLWASQGRGCPVRRVEGRPRFRLGDVRSWLQGDESKPEHA
jgi:hypothetical protein